MNKTKKIIEQIEEAIGLEYSIRESAILQSIQTSCMKLQIQLLNKDRFP